MASKPSLVLVIADLACGGAQRAISEMANYWADKGWRVTLATWRASDAQDFYGLSPKVSREWLGAGEAAAGLSSQLRAAMRRVVDLRRLIRRVRPDALLSFIDVSNVHAIAATRGLRVRTIVAERTYPGLNLTISRPWRFLRNLSYRWADQVVVQTREAAEWVEHHCRSRALVIPNALRALPTATEPREPLVLAVGRLTREKGFDLLLNAFSSVSGRFPQWHLCILGDGPERAGLAELAVRLKLTERVRFAGETRNVEDWMTRASLMVHPSRREGFPNAVLEAMAMGLAVVCTNCQAGPSDLIRDGSNGRLVPVDDCEGLARVMGELMGDRKERERLGAEAVGVRRSYSAEQVMSQWEDCLLGARTA